MTFSEPVQGTTAASEWTLDVPSSDLVTPDGAGRAVNAVADRPRPPEEDRLADTIDASSAFTGPLYVGHKDPNINTFPVWEPHATPNVMFTMPSNGLTDVAPPGGTANALETTATVTASDGIAPTVTFAVFVTTTEVHVTFSEDVTVEEGGVWTVSGLGVTNVMRESDDTVALTVNPPTIAGEEHTVGVSRASVQDGGQNTLAADASVEGVTYQETIAFAATTYRDASGEHIMVAFESAVTGTTVAGEWFVDVDADGTGGTAVATVAIRCVVGADLVTWSPLNLANLCSGVEDVEPHTIYLAYDALNSGETPRVAYRAPTGDGATPIVSELSTLPVSTRAVTAADGLAPLFTAATASSRTLTVTFDEDVTAADGGIDASRWFHYDSAADPPTRAELDAATTTFASSTLDGSTLTLTLPSDYEPATGWGSADTAAVPQTIGYRVPAGETTDITDASPAANVLADGAAVRGLADGAPPEIVTLNVMVLDDSSLRVPKTGDYAYIAGEGDAIRVTLELSEPSSTGTPPRLSALNVQATMALSNGDMTATSADVAVPGSWTRDGPLEFSIRAFDVVSILNEATFTQEDQTNDPPVRVDVNMPRIETVLITSSDLVQFTFSEDVTGTDDVSSSADSTPDDATDPSAPLLIRPAPTGSGATAALTLVPGTYIFTIGPAITDLAGNAFAAQEVTIGAVGEIESGTLIVPVGGTMPITISAPDELGRPGAPVRLLVDDLVDGDVAFGADVTVNLGDVLFTIYGGTKINDVGLADTRRAGDDYVPTDGTLIAELSRRLAGMTYHGAPDADDEDAQTANERAASAIDSREPAALATLGKRDDSVLFSQPVLIRLDGVSEADHIFFMDAVQDGDALHVAGENRVRVTAIPTCDAAGYEDIDAETPPNLGDATTEALAADCHVRDGRDIVIWTNHFTDAGATAQGTDAGGGGCDNCTPPTLGIDSTGLRRVSNGFSYNGDTIDAEYYYTPMPLITVETGIENVAVIRVFEDSGPHNIRHVGIGFGLSRGQHFAESQAEIRVSLPFDGSGPTPSLDDPENAIDDASLRVYSEIGECMEGSAARCLAVTIHHTFRAPLEFDVVSTVVWDDRRNSWQNFFNHGVHVGGESLNPSHGIEVNGGALTLYPLIAGKVDSDGDGTYDYDGRHVTYMLDSEFRVYRLTPAGTYEPLRNLASLHHEIDESMYDETRPTQHGPIRGTDSFDDLIAEQRALAAEILASMGIERPEEGAPDVKSHDYAPERERLEILGEAIAAEINAAELEKQTMYPLMYRSE